MKKKLFALVGTALAVSLCASAFSACAPNEKKGHTHTLHDVAAKAATCTEEGNIAYQKCDYCQKVLVNGEEVSEESVMIPIDANNHDLHDVAEITAKCVENGVKAHQECSWCHKLFLDGAETTENQLLIAANGNHNWSGLECTEGDAYKLLYNGDYYTVDHSNEQNFEECPLGNKATFSSDGTQEYPYLTSALANRNTFYSWAMAANTVTNLGSQWQIGYGTGVRVASYTNFAYGNEDGSPYIGRFLMTFDITSSETRKFSRIGVKLVNGQANEFADQSKLLGLLSTEENNADRSLTAEVVYRFVYALEVTSEDQLVRIYTQTQTTSGNQTNLTISNLHLIKLDGGATGVPGATLCYFGEAENSVVAKEDCTHAWEYTASREANCLHSGLVAHQYCPQCGLKRIDGAEVTSEDVYIPMTDHSLTSYEAKEATCTEEGNVAYSYCSTCQKYFTDDSAQTELTYDQIVIPKTEHNMVDGVCTVCGYSEYESVYQEAEIKVANPDTAFGTAATTVNPDLLANPGTWACQTTKNTSTATVEDGVLKATMNSNNTANKIKIFTRVYPSKDGKTAFVGTYLWTFDFVVTAATGNSAEAASLMVGYFIQDVDGASLLTIDDVTKEFKVGVTYRFAVLVEVAQEGLYAQFNVRNGAGSGASFEISNASFTYYPASQNTGANRLENVVFAEAIHAAHEYVLHDAVASTCQTAGNQAYYTCSICDKYFDADKNELDGVPTLPLADHVTGDWQSDSTGHWKVCSVCGEVVEKHDHIAGPEATETTPQTCTECGFVITSPLGHTHAMSYTAAKAATCDEGGNTEYYYCSGCEKYFADEAGTQELNASAVFTEKLGHTMNEKVEAVAVTCEEGGNLAYYFCTVCEKYFADEEGTQELKASEVFLEKLGHSLTDYTAQASTCYKPGNEIAYSHCSTCGKYFTDHSATAELPVEQIFTLAMTDHHFKNGVCTNAGCGATQQASTIAVANPDTAFGTTAAVVNPDLLANPGTWACQNSTKSATTAAISEDTLRVTINSNSKDKQNKVFVRVLPAKDGKAFVGTYLWSFDFKVTAGTGASTEETYLWVGYMIQNVGGTAQDTFGTVAEELTSFKVGETYRFSVLVETVDAGLYAQFNVRNGAGYGASFEISNASFTFYPASANLGVNRLGKVLFAELVTTGTDAAAVATVEAMLPENKSEYTD